MAASRTPGATVPLELKRQGERLNEQMENLQTILNNSTTYLGEIVNIMDGYGDDVVAEIRKLINAIESYKSKSATIYSEVATNLITYANNLMSNLDGLRSSVSAISQSVENL